MAKTPAETLGTLLFFVFCPLHPNSQQLSKKASFCHYLAFLNFGIFKTGTKTQSNLQKRGVSGTTWTLFFLFYRLNSGQNPRVQVNTYKTFENFRKISKYIDIDREKTYIAENFKNFLAYLPGLLGFFAKKHYKIGNRESR